MSVGCGGPLSASQRVVGKWRGRPETAQERTEREWPGGTLPGKAASDATGLDAAGPGVVGASAAPRSEPTDLEAWPEVRIELDLRSDGSTRMTLDGERPREGVWRLVTSDGPRATLEIEIDPPGDDDRRVEPDAVVPGVRRRFRLVFLPPADGEPDRFTLAEEGADPRFGRLIFQRDDAP